MDELARIFKGGVAIFESFGDHAIAFSCGDAVYLSAELDTFGDAVHGNYTSGAVESAVAMVEVARRTSMITTMA